MPQQLRVSKKLDATGANVIGIADFLMPWGQSTGYGHPKRFFVDPANGSDNNNGRSWASAYATFEKGIDACRFVNGDAGGTTITYTDKSVRSFLFLAPGHYNEDTELLWSGYNISVIGCGTPVPGKDYGVSLNYDGSSASTAAFLISGSGNEVCGLHIYCDAAIPALYVYNGDNNFVHDIVIECDGTTCTYGIYTDSMKGSRIENVYIRNPITAGIYVAGGADHYAIDGHIKDCSIGCATNGAVGIYVQSTNTCYNFWIDRNRVNMHGGSSDKGIDIDATSGVLVIDNYVSVPSSGTPIEHAGGEQFWMGNHTAAGTTNVDPAPAAG